MNDPVEHCAAFQVFPPGRRIDFPLWLKYSWVFRELQEDWWGDGFKKRIFLKPSVREERARRHVTDKERDDDDDDDGHQYIYTYTYTSVKKASVPRGLRSSCNAALRRCVSQKFALPYG